MDAVISWIDSTDYKIQNNIIINNYSKTYDMYRIGSRDSLRYALRGLYYNLPWLENIYLVTNDQWPKWLDENKCLQINPKIIRVDQTLINPEKKPMHGSVAVEVCLDNIPNLSNNFIYSNDDMFVIKHMNIEEWIENGILKVRGNDTVKDMEEQAFLSSLPDFIYQRSVYNQYLIAKSLYPDLNWLRNPHQVSIFSKLSYKIAKEKLPELYSLTYKLVGRPDINYLGRTILEYINIGEGITNNVTKSVGVDWFYIDPTTTNFESELNLDSKVKLLCINNIFQLPDYVENYLKTIFPNPIPAEKLI
jgi:hypothetical protein